MSDPSESPLDSHTFEQTFAEIELCLDRFLPLAPLENIHQLRDAIVDVPIDHQSMALIELIKVDMYAAAEAGSLRTIQMYLDALSDLLPREKVPLDLVMEEIQLRREAGQPLSLNGFQRNFPHLAGSLANVLSASQSVSPVGGLLKPPDMAANEKIDDFTIVSALGHGAFANVYLARQESMQRLVALKVAGRGGEESQTLAQLDHPNIVRVFDQRLIRNPPLTLLYMQYVPGGTLAHVVQLMRDTPSGSVDGRLLLDAVDRSLLSAGQPPPENSAIRNHVRSMDWPTAVAWIGIQLAEGLGYAHGRGVLHRDIKPANILLSADGVPRLADFNVSHRGVAGRAGASAHFGGSLAYMSPEQLRAADAADSFEAEDLDQRSDLYSLGIVLWELWQGTRPWRQNEIVESWQHAIAIQQSFRRSDSVMPHRLGGAAERVLEKTIRRTLQLDRNDRHQTGNELAGQLRLALFPDAAARFYPNPGSLGDRLLRLPVLVVCSVTVLLPNAVAGLLNFLYNRSQIVTMYPDLQTKFDILSTLVNCTAFPIGFILIAWFARLVRLGVHSANKSKPVPAECLWATVNLGHQSAVFGGLLWLIAGFVFPIVLRNYSAEFSGTDTVHFFLSMILFGGIAWIYPFFGITLIAVLVYYPKLVSASMVDGDFLSRMAFVRRRATSYLLSAAIVPLVALALLILRPDAPQSILLVVVCLTAIGLVASFLAHQKISEAIQQMAKVLAPTSN